MNNKKAITITMLVITIIIITILAGVITVSMSSTINYSRISSWTNEIGYIQDLVSERLKQVSALDYTLGSINLNVSELNQAQIDEQFGGETIDTNKNIELQIIDLSKLKVTDTVYGNMDTLNDVYAVSYITGRVYYVKGIKANGNMYYALSKSILDMYQIETNESNLSTVVFVPSVIGYTNKPVSVTVKMPSTFTGISITTSNTNILIGEQKLVNNTYVCDINTNEVAVNYDVTVTYNNGSQSYTSKYTVNNYDIKKPVIEDISEQSFLTKNGDIHIINIKATDESGIKYFKYTPGEIAEEEAQEYFGLNGNNVSSGKINLSENTNIYTLYAEDNAGNHTVLTFDKNDYIEGAWVAYYTEDGVPIPKGFVASPYTDEDTKDEGLVIYQLTLEEIKQGITELPIENQYTSWTTRNQYVWVPVDSTKFSETFVRKDFLNETSELAVTLGTADKYWEVLPTTALTTENLKYVTKETIEEIQQMYISVKEYGGFYIGRYEAGIDTQRTSNNGVLETNIYSMMGKLPYNYVLWGSLTNEKGGVVEAARSVYKKTNINYGVVSTLVYGVQWDRMISWWQEIKATDINGNEIDISNSAVYGNCYSVVINPDEFNSKAKYAVYQSGFGLYQDVTSDTTKIKNDFWLLSTGALKRAKIKNIYDTAGNLWEWTMEGYSTSTHAGRGQSFLSDSVSVAKRSHTGNDLSAGFRTALYIKP